MAGTYRHISIADIVNNFMVAYVGDGKLIDTVSKSDVIFHVKRGMQEFSYDVSRTVKSQEVEVPSTLTIPMPSDYVNYVKICYIDNNGIKRIIYPTTLTINPTQSAFQDTDGGIITDGDGKIIDGDSVTNERWSGFDTDNITGRANPADTSIEVKDHHMGQEYGNRYGLNPEHTQINGYFTINEKTGSFNFSSDLVGKIIVIEYLSDSLGTDSEMKVHKFAEEALYKHVLYNVLSIKRNIPEYVVQRYKKEKRATLRNAKLRLSNLKLSELTQVMRNKAKHIK